MKSRFLKGFKLNASEPDRLSFGLEGDESGFEEFRGPELEEIRGGSHLVARIELRMLVAEDFDAVDAMDDFVAAMNLESDPLQESTVGTRAERDRLRSTAESLALGKEAK